jgi:hypothetical protein
LIGSGRVLSLLVSSHFRFRVVSGRVGLVIGSSSVGLFHISNHIRSGRLSGHFGFRIVSGQVRLVIGSSSVGSFWILNHIRLDWIGSD